LLPPVEPFRDSFALAHLELFADLEAQAVAVSPLPPAIEIDAAPDPDFGALYRVWRGMALLGSFYINHDGFYITQPLYSDTKTQHPTEPAAIQAIVQNLAHQGG